MKNITAYIKRHMLSKVTLALHKIDRLTGVTVSDVKGFGHHEKEIFDDYLDYQPYVKIEIFCIDEIVDQVVDTIEKKAHTGLQGDGKIYISQVEEAIRISTGERGKKAV